MRTRLLALAVLGGAAVTLPTLPAEAAVPRCDGERATIVGTPRDDRLTGTPGRDVIVGRGGGDQIRGLGGDDVLCGDDGADLLEGGGGDDRLFAGKSEYVHDYADFHAWDRLDGGSGDDHFDTGAEKSLYQWDVTGLIDFSSAPRGIDLDLAAGTATGWGHDTIAPQRGLEIEGSEHDDVLRGSGRWEVISGLGGDDLIEGRGGNDLLDAEEEGNNLRGPSDHDVVNGGAGDDDVGGRRGSDVLRGGSGDDNVYSRSREPSQVYGDQGDDSVSVKVTKEAGYVLDGGAGLDDADLDAPGIGPDPVDGVLEVRMDPGTIAREGIVTGRIAGVEDVWLGENLTVDYYGTDAAERVDADPAVLLRAWTYGGDDVVVGVEP